MSVGPRRVHDVLAVSGLAFESRIAAGPGVRTLSGAGRSAALAAAIADALREQAAAVVSFGVAGALTAALRPGAIVIGASIVGPDGVQATHDAWTRALIDRLPGALLAPIAGVDAIVTNPDAKRALRDATGAAAVDMESHIAARVAAEHGLPFVALRAIADPLERALPPAARVSMREDGALDLPAVLGSLGRQPGQLPTLLRIGLDTRRALRALRESRRLLGDRLGYADLDQLLLDVV